MGYTRVRISPLATISKSSPSKLTESPLATAYLVTPSMELPPSRSEVSMRVLYLKTKTLRPSSPRVSMRSASMESPNV